MAKTYLEVNPASTVVVLDSAESVGGVWAKERLYPGLQTNNLYGSLAYSDFPMDEETFRVKEGEFIPGTVVHQYLHAYAEKFDIDRRIRFESRVYKVDRKDTGGWVVHYSQNGKTDKTLLARRLVLSTGLTSEPFVPLFSGDESFDAPIFHVKNLADNVVKASKVAQNVVILGGSKSAYDAAYVHASAGVTVDWVIRKSGHGPAWMAPIYVTPLKRRLDQLVGVRFLTWFSPCIWGDFDGFGGMRRFFNNTRIGRWLANGFWNILTNDVLTLSGYDQHPETQKLKPWTSAFWSATALGIFNYPTDFFDFVRDGTVKVHIADVTHLSPHTVHLSTGEALPADALICSTGWKHRPTIDFGPAGQEAMLGLPHRATDREDVLIAKAENEILRRYPRLAAQPFADRGYRPQRGGEEAGEEERNEPFRLYRFMVPPALINERTIGFTGMMMSLHTSVQAQAQALWLTAYFAGGLPRTEEGSLLSSSSVGADAAGRGDGDGRGSAVGVGRKGWFDEEEVRWETVLHSQFGKWRCPTGHGRRYPDVAFDAVPYVDMLLRDLGLRWRRKGSWLGEVFGAYGPGDYGGLVGEWMRVGRGGRID